MIRSKLVSYIDDYGDVTLTSDEVVEFMLEGQDISGIILSDNDDLEQYKNMQIIMGDGTPTINSPKSHNTTPEKYLLKRSKKWFIPAEYYYMDIGDYLIQRCNNDDEIQRVKEELVEFNKRKEIEILKVMVYIVDQFRKNNVVWGVGRGSSVSCFCFYLIGINKINPMKYDISYTDFFKE